MACGGLLVLAQYSGVRKCAERGRVVLHPATGRRGPSAASLDRRAQSMLASWAPFAAQFCFVLFLWEEVNRGPEVDFVDWGCDVRTVTRLLLTFP